MGLFGKKREKTQAELDEEDAREYCRQMDIPYKTDQERIEEQGWISYGVGQSKGRRDGSEDDGPDPFRGSDYI